MPFRVVAFVAFLTTQITQTQEERHIPLTIPSGTPFRVVALVAFPYCLNHANTRRAPHVPEQT